MIQGETENTGETVTTHAGRVVQVTRSKITCDCGHDTFNLYLYDAIRVCDRNMFHIICGKCGKCQMWM